LGKMGQYRGNRGNGGRKAGTQENGRPAKGKFKAEQELVLGGRTGARKV